MNSPSPRPDRPVSARGRDRARYVLLVWCVLTAMGGGTFATPVDLRLRVAWGGGQRVAWRGRISISEGSLSDPRCLGLDLDAPGSLLLVRNTIPIQPLRPRRYEALDVTVTAPMTAVLRVELANAAAESPPVVTEIPLHDLLVQSRTQSLDAAGSRLLVHRAPGDEIRVEFARDHLVFAPGERWKIDVRPHHVPLQEATDVRFQAQVRGGRNGAAVWKTQQALLPGANGELPPIEQLSVPIPELEGVYDLVLSLTPRRARPLFLSESESVERRVQFVVLNHRAPARPAERPWREVLALDASQPRWWERLTRLPSWTPLPGGPTRVVQQGTAQPWRHEGRLVNRLEPDQWQAYPLPVSHLGKPHRLEIEYPPDWPQTTAVSIVEIDDAGSFRSTGVDTALHVDSGLIPLGRPVDTYELIFWPKSRVPFLLLRNMDPRQPSLFGRIRVLEGPDQLAPLAPRVSTIGQRTPLAQFDRPGFAEMFSASLGVDRRSQRALTDWQTFYEGGTRMVAYLKHVGFAGASLTGWCEGGAIYPARHLDATPRFDNGAYFNSGQDPFAKDALELLFRLFDREELLLLPGLRFNTPLPALERELLDPVAAEGIVLVDREGHTASAGTPSRDEVRYNPLDRRVQDAMVAEVRHLAQRYGQHESFAGLALDLAADGYTQLPGLQWGYDPRTLVQFMREIGSPDPRLTRAQILERLEDETISRAWLEWRTNRIADLYRRMLAEIHAVRPEARLYLAGGRLVSAGTLQRAAHPSLPRRDVITVALREMGLDSEKLSQQPGLVFLRPHRQELGRPLAAGGPALQLSTAAEADSWFQQVSHRSHLFYHRPVALPAPVNADSEAGAGGDLLLTAVMPAGDASRQRWSHALAQDDAHLLLDGGWSVMLGEADQLRAFCEVFRQLPAERFRDAAPPAVQPDSPVVLRTLEKADKTYFYAVNDSPWRVQLHVSWQVPATCRCRSLGTVSATASVNRDAHHLSWRQALPPFGLTAGVLTAAPVQVLAIDTQLPAEIPARLQARVADLSGRVANLKEPQPWEVLQNAGFEAPPEDGPIPGWEFDSEAETEARVDQQHKFAGATALRLSSRGPVAWARSDSFTPPSAGRLSLQVMLRSVNAADPPPLRLAVEGRLDGRAYYRYAQITPPSSAESAAHDWSPFVLHIDDLPSDGLKDLRVRFDLMGPGVVWIDDVQLFDRNFTRDEVRELSKIIALADLQLREGRLTACARTLDSYWPRFITTHVAAERRDLATAPPRETDDDVNRRGPPPSDPPARFLDRLRRFSPRLPRR